MSWTIIARLVIYAAISYLLAPKGPEAPAQATLEDFDIPKPDPSANIPVVFGTAWIKSSNVVWYGDLATTPIKTKSGK